MISRISPSTQFKAAKLLAALAVAGLAQQAVAAAPAPNTLPTGGQVVAGTATIATAGNTMNVNQTSQRAVVNWSSFDVGSKATVNFNQPNAQAATLNYVNSASKSMINGAVNANGQVIFVNNNGIVFGKSAQVNVGGMVATTMNTSAKEFMEGRDIQTYEGGTSGKVINKGNITGNNINSYIALMAPQVINTGVITATMGGNNAIALVAGQKVTLQFSGSQFVSVSVDASVVNALISNKLLINAGNGQVIIGANAAQNLMGSLIKNTGTISASDINTSGGKITLTADTIEQSGAIEASSSQAAGGNISLKGNHITLASGSKTIATGATSGGNINVGVNNASTQSLQNAIENNNLANTVSVQTNATVDASATQSGNGGAINIWSKLSTMVAGTLSAKGGAQGGNGGFIETSSKGTVSIASATKLDTSAPKGRAGQWVIDPTTLIIDSAAAAAISNALNTTSVTLDATGSSCSAFGGCTQSQSALIRIMAGADIYSSNTASSLSLVATGGQIDIDSNITAGAVYAVAQTINVNGSINTNGGPNSNIYLAGAIINILGNINSNGNSQNSNTNTTSSSLNTINTSTANNRRNGSTANNQNTLTADGNNYISNGGLINILTTGDINIGSTNISNATNLNTNPNSYISANGVHGGTITILSTAGKVNVNAVIDTLGKSGNAGKIDIAGKDQTNLTNALISTEGISQGGLLNLGQINNLGNGTILAPPATAPPALSTYVQNTVAAAALNSNNGITSSSIIIDGQTGINAPNGNIVVFGDQIEVNHSSIIADHGVIIIGREGYSSGGLSKLTAVSNSTLIAHKVETSAELLGTDAVTVLASEWLLDPTNVTIAAGAAGGSTGGSLASALVNAGVITITAGDIQAAINAGTSVNVVATGEITQSGALNFVNNSGTAATLTLDNTSGSKKAMTLSGGITATGSSLTNIVAKTAGGQIVISGAVNVTGAVTLDNTYAVGGSTSGFINETNGITYIGAVAGSIWGVKNTGTITAKTISVTAANSGYTNMGFWAAANLTASGDINVYATNQFAQTSAGAGSVAFYTNSALNITSTGGTVNIIGKVQGTSANYSSGGIHFANATAAATVNVTANKISLEGYSTNSAVDTSTTGIGINSNFTKFTINAGADYSAGGPAISFYGSSIVGAGRGLRFTNGTITNNASGGDVLLVANNNIFNSNNIVVATNNTANASKVLFDTTSGNSTGTIENSGAITSTGGTTATGSNLTNILVKSSGGKIFSSGTINISGDITVSNRYNVGGTNSTFINQYNASANTATYLQTTAGVTITAGISAKNINIYGAYNGYLSSAVWLQANLTATGNINLAGYHSIAAAAGNNNGSAGIYTNGALNFNAGGTFFVDGNTNSTVAGLSGIGVYLWAGTGTAKLNVIANKIQILGSSTNTSAGGDTTATSLNLANGVNFTIRNSNDYVNGGEAFSFRSTVVTNFGRGIRVSNGSITNNSNGGDIVFVSNGSIGTFVPISLAKNTSTVATKVLYDTTTATSTGFIDNTGAITVAADSTSAVNLIQKSNGGTISNGAGAINVSGYIDINNNAVSGPSATATTLNSLGASITGPMTSGTLAGNIGVRINAIATGTGLGINGTSTITSLVGPVTLTGQSATANAIKLTGAVSSAAGFTAVGTSTTAPTVVAVAAITNTTGNISITGNAAAAGANTGISATGAITQNQVGGNISFISNNKISQTGTVALVANTGGTAANVLYDTRTGNSGSTIQNGALSIGAGTSTSAINFSVLTNGALITNGGVIVPGYILIDNTNGSSSTATLANVNGTTIIGALSAGTLAGSTGVRINTVSSGTGVGIQDVAAITALAGPVTLTSISETANSINLTAASSITSAGGISIIGTSSQAFATADTAGAYGAVSVLGQVTNTGAGGVVVQSTANTATGAITDSGAGGISITGGYNIAAGTVTGGTITAVGALNNTNGGVISLSMAQPTSATGGAIEDAAGVTNAVASVGTNVTYSLRGGVMNLAYAGVNNVNYRSPLTPATISVQLLDSYVTTYGVAFTDAAPQAWIKNAANTAVTVSGGGAFGASPTASSVLGSLSLSSINGVATIAANRVGGPTTLITGDILSTFGLVTITAPAAGKGTYTVNPATLTIASKSSSSAYDGVTTFNTLTQAGYSVAGLISTIGGTPTGDAVTSTTSAINVGNSSGAAVTGSSVATAGTFSVIESLAQGSNLSNYTINYVRSTFNVTPVALTITAANDSKTYGSTSTNAGIAYNASGVKTTSADGFTISGLLGSDAVNTVTLSSLTGAIAAANASITPYSVTPSAAAGTGLSNYSINYIDGGLTVNKAVLTITNPTMVYNGTTTFATATSGTAATVTGVGGQTFTLGGSATMTNPNVLGGSNITSTAGLTFAGSGSSNYELPASIANVVITPAPLTVTLAPQTKTYDSTTGAVLTAGTSSTNGSYTIGGFVSGQGAFITQTSGAYNSANASTSGLSSVATTVSTTLSPSNWTANSGTSLSNYSLPTTASATGTITKAPLAILANDVSTFVNTQPAAGNLTYVVSGLVGTDTSSVFTVAPAVALASDASLTTAGVFAGKVIPSVTAPNYTVTATPGTLTILGSNAILVAVGTTSKVYGTYNATQTANIQADIAPPGTGTPIVTVQYKPAVSGVVDFTVARNSSTGVWTAVDGVSGNSATYTFTVTPTIPAGSYSTTNHLRVGSYALVPANLTLASGSTANCSSCSVSYTSGTLTITPAQLLATVTPSAMTYNASAAMTSTTVLSGTGVFAGVPSGVSGVTTLTAASPNAGVTAINNGGTLLSGHDAANFTVTTTVLVPQAAGGPTNGVAAPGTATTDGSGYTINIAKAPLVYSGVVRSSVYTSNAQTNTGATLTSGTLYSTDNFTIAGYASATNVSQGTVADILAATAAGSTVANNYAITYNHGSLTITGAPLIITATADSKTYGSTTTNSGIAYNASGVKTLTADGYTVGGLIGSDAVSSVTLSSSGALAAANVVGSPYAITPSVAAGTGNLSNYTISYVNGVLTVNPAVLTIANPTMVYNGTATFAPGVSGATTTFTGVNGQTVTLGGSATMTNANVLGTSAINNTAGLTVASVSGGVDASNYALPTSIANVDITPAPITYTGKNTTTVFNNTLQTNNGATLTSGTVFGSDSFAISGYATKTDVSRVGNIASGALSSSPDALIATATGATNPNNYTITYVQGGLTITPAPLTATVTPAALIYNGSGAITSTTALSGFVGGATDVLGATALTAGSPNAGTQTITNGGTTLSGTDSLNYAVTNTVLATTTGTGANGVASVSPTPAGGGYTIDVARRILVYTGQVTTSPYSGAEQTNAGASLTTGTIVSGQSFTLGGYAKATNVSQGIVVDQLAATPGANTLSANYDIRYVNGSIKITPLTLSVSITTLPNSGIKVYDSTTAATLTAGTSSSPGSYAITGFVSGQGAYITQAAGTYNSANVAGATTITAALTPSVWTTTGSTDLSNYALPTSITAPGSITPAPLSITANNAATFVGVTPTNPTYVVSGLVGTDTPSSAFTVGPTVSLNSTGTAGLAAPGTYAGSLIPAVTAPNYTVTPTAGTLTVVGNSILVVSVGTTSQVFGNYNEAQVNNGTISKAAPNVTVGYCTNCDVAGVTPATRNIVNLTVTAPSSGSTSANSLWTAADSISVGTSAQGIYNFTVTPTVAGGSYSTGNYLKVGNYALVPGNVTTVAGQTTNYQGTPIYTSGNLNITPLTLTFGAATPTQTYNGLTAINGLALTPTNLPTGITGITSVVGNGNFTSPNANLAAGYTINNALISGPDAANFAFAGASGTSGIINKAQLVYTGVVNVSVFNGATQTNSGATLTSGTIATGESFAIGGYAQQRNVLATATPDALAASPGSNTLASNYQITYNNGSLRITPAPLTATVTAAGLTYNGSNAISSTTVLTGFVGGATSVTGATSLTAAVADAGVQTIINGGTVLSGAELANYSVTNTVLASTASNGVAAVNAAPNGSGYTINIAKAPLTYTSGNNTVTFNGTAQSNSGAVLSSGSIVAGQSFTLSGYATGTNVTDMPIDALSATANANTNLNNYAITFVNGSLSINPAPLTISGLTAVSKFEDGNTVAVITGTPTLAGQIFTDYPVEISSGSVTQGVFAQATARRSIPVSAAWENFTLSDPNYFIQGPTQALNATISRNLTSSLNPAPAPAAASTPAPAPAVASTPAPAPEKLNNMTLIANQNLAQVIDKRDEPAAQPNTLIKGEMLYVRDSDNPSVYLHAFPTPSSGALKFPVPDQLTQELIESSGRNDTVSGSPASLSGYKLLLLPKDSTLTATLEDGSPLPSGILFNVANRSFSVPKLADVTLPITVKIALVRGKNVLSDKTLVVTK